VRVLEPFVGAVTLCLVAAPASAAGEASFDIPAGPLSGALIALAGQARITIVANDPALARIRARPVRGRMTLRAALTKLLGGTGYGFVMAAPDAVRIVRLPRPAPAPRTVPTSATPKPSPVPAAAAPLEEIVVTASKQGVLLSDLPSTARVIDLGEEEGARRGSRGSEGIVARLPMLASTHLGPGRNKLYIRGIADSSFNGPSQSIVGEYLGDLRLTFNAPDPDLRLYDMSRVELLEGPQGTLYGSGSLGGILRLVPTPPNLDEPEGQVSAGVASTRHGGIGGDAAAVLNLPLARGRMALRAVGYAVSEAGWIDVGQDRRDVNRTRINGGRAVLLFAPGGGWRIELAGVAQFIAGRDGQYAERGLPPLTRSTRLPQPFDNDYLLGGVTVRRNWNGLELVSATSLVDHSLDSRFDASGGAGIAGTQLFREDLSIRVLAHETRLSGRIRGGLGWLAGFSGVGDVTRVERTLGPPGAPAPLTGVRNSTSEAALFGQLSFPLGARVTITAGGRATWSRGAGIVLHAPDREENEPTRSDFRLSPTLAISWRPARDLLVYARYADAFRAGGLAVSSTGSASAAQRFESDELGSAEVGLRYGSSASRFSADVAFSRTRWSDIQADLIDSRGLPFTTNIGNGRIYAAEARATWRPRPWLAFDASAFLSDSALDSPGSAFATADERSLPNIPEAGARAGVRAERRLGPAATLGLDASVRYVGRSKLGIGPPLDASQGGYAAADVGVRLWLGRTGLSLDVENAADGRGNRFSYGNPFTVAARMQTTPLRPRTVRLGIDLPF
jgi:iron complex outermembrane receptor protein